MRWYAIITALLALVAYYVEIPTHLFLGVVAAVLGSGTEALRHKVVPLAKLRGDDHVEQPMA